MKSTRLVVALPLLLLTVLAATLACAQTAGHDLTLRERIRERIAERQRGGAASESAAADSNPDAKITAPGDYVYSLDVGGLQRRYRVHVPASYNPQHPSALLVSLHGGGANMDYQANDDNYGQIPKSNREGFIVVFPNGFSPFPSGKLATWNAGGCCGPARDKNIDDVAFIRAMLARLTQQLSIDKQKIFATGMSNGGLMAHRLACEMADTFKAIAAVAATDNTKACHPSRPVSVLEIHAKNDDHLPFNGGMGAKSRRSAVTDFTSVPTSIARWVARDECAAPAKRVLDKEGAYCDRYAPCKGNTAVELCVTATGGHSWPGAIKSRGSEPTSKAIDANDVMWNFFLGR